MAENLPCGIVARPGWTLRLLAASFYMGLAPVLRPFGCRRDDPFVRHHAAQALATIFILLAILAGGFLYWLLLTYAIVYQRELYESLFASSGWAAPVRDGIPLGIAIVAWLVIWVGGLLLAISGSTRSVPLIARLARRPRLIRLAWVGNALLCVVVLLVSAIAIHASYLTRQDDKPAPVYLLYDDMGIVPHWVFNVGFYRIALSATARWGPGSVVVAPLDEHHLRLALNNGKFVFLACHGRDGDIVSPQQWIVPHLLFADESEKPNHGVYVTIHDTSGPDQPWIALPAGQSLRLVYNTACDGGAKAQMWEAAFAPAEVKTFDRLSTVAEHIVWLWDDGPERVRSMK